MCESYHWGLWFLKNKSELYGPFNKPWLHLGMWDPWLLLRKEMCLTHLPQFCFADWQRFSDISVSILLLPTWEFFSILRVKLGARSNQQLCLQRGSKKIKMVFLPCNQNPAFFSCAWMGPPSWFFDPLWTPLLSNDSFASVYMETVKIDGPCTISHRSNLNITYISYRESNSSCPSISRSEAMYVFT